MLSTWQGLVLYKQIAKATVATCLNSPIQPGAHGGCLSACVTCLISGLRLVSVSCIAVVLGLTEGRMPWLQKTFRVWEQRDEGEETQGPELALWQPLGAVVSGGCRRHPALPYMTQLPASGTLTV